MGYQTEERERQELQADIARLQDLVSVLSDDEIPPDPDEDSDGTLCCRDAKRKWQAQKDRADAAEKAYAEQAREIERLTKEGNRDYGDKVVFYDRAITAEAALVPWREQAEEWEARATAAEAQVARLEEALAKSHDFHGDQARRLRAMVYRATAAEAREARLKDAAWQCLDDMGKSGHCVCEAAKAKLREAYGENGEDDPLDYTLDDARAALTDGETDGLDD